MTTYVRSSEAARLLGVSPATLYAYVSRGRISRLRAADGRTSLFAVDEIDALRTASRRADPNPRPTIDVQIASSITRLADDGVELRGFALTDLQRDHRFEDVAELLLTGELPPTPTAWRPPEDSDVAAVIAPIAAMVAKPIGRLIVTATALAGLHPDDDTAQAVRRLLGVAPNALAAQAGTPGSTLDPDVQRSVPDPDVKRSVPDPDVKRSVPDPGYAGRLCEVWVAQPGAALVDAVDAALVLLADHELATSTLAVRIAASVRSSPYTAIVAGLATLEGALHGSAASAVHRFLDDCLVDEPSTVVARARADHRRIPGFGHKVYRHEDPRFGPLLDAVRQIAPGDIRLDVIDLVLAEILRVIPSAPNVDFALGALSWLAGLPDDVPIFAVARIAGWAAHYDEELTEPPVRFRGLARTPA